MKTFGSENDIDTICLCSSCKIENIRILMCQVETNLNIKYIIYLRVVAPVRYLEILNVVFLGNKASNDAETF